MVPVVGLGAGGHAKVVIEILRVCGEYEVVGLLDPQEDLWGTEVLGVSVRGDDSMLRGLYTDGVRHAFIGLGGLGCTAARRRLYGTAQQEMFEVVAAIHPDAVVSRSARIGHGPTVMAGAVVNADATLGANVIINTGAIVEHDCVIEDHVHIATGARLAGNVRVGEGAHVGLGASVRQSISVGAGAVIGAGAVVVKDVQPNTVVAGVPARPLRKTSGRESPANLPA